MDFDLTIERYYQALSEFHKGRPKLILDMFSQRDDVSLANPLGSAVRGREKVVETAEGAASNSSVKAFRCAKSVAASTGSSGSFIRIREELLML